jgi:hypothetical protein
MRVDCLRRDVCEPGVIVLQPVDQVIGETDEGVHALVNFKIPAGGNPDVSLRKLFAGEHDAAPFGGPWLIEIGLDGNAGCVDIHTDMQRAGIDHSVAACTPTPWTEIRNRDVIKVLMAVRAAVHSEGNVQANTDSCARVRSADARGPPDRRFVRMRATRAKRK